MHIQYMDNPYEVENWIETLSDKERALFNKGYVVALFGLLEQISESKAKIINKLIDIDEGSSDWIQLKARLLLLDIYEKHYANRVKNLTSQLV